LEAIALTLRFQDVAPVGKSIEGGTVEAFTSEDFGRVLEWKIRGDDNAVAFIGG
jgi:hypothetical protein